MNSTNTEINNIMLEGPIEYIYFTDDQDRYKKCLKFLGCKFYDNCKIANKHETSYYIIVDDYGYNSSPNLNFIRRFSNFCVNCFVPRGPVIIEAINNINGESKSMDISLKDLRKLVIDIQYNKLSSNPISGNVYNFMMLCYKKDQKEKTKEEQKWMINAIKKKENHNQREKEQREKEQQEKEQQEKEQREKERRKKIEIHDQREKKEREQKRREEKELKLKRSRDAEERKAKRQAEQDNWLEKQRKKKEEKKKVKKIKD